MPLTNPNKVVTEERLSEFYGQILPYMGGMPDVLANKFSKGDLYSTDEKMIGVWTDNKPLYQKTLKITPSISGISLATDVDVFVNAPVILRLYEAGSDYYVTDVGTGQENWLLFKIESNVLKCCTLSNKYTSGEAVVSVQYTKTTDSPISIGSDTDYSTTEKIVGTWIDGSPVWQKTVSTGGSVPTGATLILRTAMASTGYDTILYTKAS